MSDTNYKKVNSLYNYIEDHVDTKSNILESESPIKSKILGTLLDRGNNVTKSPLSNRFLASMSSSQEDLSKNDIYTANRILDKLGISHGELTREQARIVVDKTTKFVNSNGYNLGFLGGVASAIVAGLALMNPVELGVLSRILMGVLGITGMVGFAMYSGETQQRKNAKELPGFREKLMQKISSVVGRDKNPKPQYKFQQMPDYGKNKEYADKLELGAVLGSVGGVGLNMLSNEFLMHQANKPDNYGSKGIEDFFNRAKEANPKLHDLSLANRSKEITNIDIGPHYMPRMAILHDSSPYVNMATKKNVGILAHEMGHATDFAKKNKYINFAKFIGETALSKPVVKGAILAGMTASDNTRDYAVPAYLATFAPTLLDEAKANYHGYKLMKNLQGKAAANNFLKKIVSTNTASYWSVPVGIGAGMYAFKHHLDKKYGKQKK